MDTWLCSYLDNKAWMSSAPTTLSFPQPHRQLSKEWDGRGLWMVSIVDDPTISPSIDIAETAMSVYELPSTNEVVQFLHAALGHPTRATLLTSTQHGNLVTFPGMTPENISQHFPKLDETQKGHMKQTKQGVRSTKVVDEEAMLGYQPKPGVKHKDVYLKIFDATKKLMFSNQTGKFPITSAHGNKYIMVAVKLDGNYIDCELIQSRKAKSLTKAYQAIFQRWKATGVICPNWHILDNEAPEELKQAIRENKCKVELTPADQHRWNAAEWAIQTFKGHFISVLAGFADSFPINQWDELLPQTILTLNLLQQPNVAPNISAYAYHHGSFDYNCMPIAPMGCAVQFHIKPSQQKTFGEHSEDGFYLKTSAEHYRTHVVFCKKTRAKQLADTVFFKHKHITQPTVTPADAIVNAFNKLQEAIHGTQQSKTNWKHSSTIWQSCNQNSRTSQTSKGGTTNANCTYLACSKGAFWQCTTHGTWPFALIGCRVTQEANCWATTRAYPQTAQVYWRVHGSTGMNTTSPITNNHQGINCWLSSLPEMRSNPRSSQSRYHSTPRIPPSTKTPMIQRCMD